MPIDARLLAELLSLSSALSFAVGDIVSRFAVRYAPPFTGAFLTGVVGLAGYGALAFPTASWGGLPLAGLLWFLLAGLIHPGLGVICFYASVRRVGVTRTAAIGGTSPLFGVLIAVLFLGERPGPFAWLGTLAIVLGVVLIALEGSGKRMRRGDLGFPILTAFFFGLVPVLRKAGLNHIPSPFFGVALSSLSGVLCLLAFSGLFPKEERYVFNRKGTFFYSLCAIIYGVAVLLYFQALRQGEVSLVVPLLFVYPLMVLAISYAVLGGVERITLRLLGGALLIVAGVFLITSFA